MSGTAGRGGSEGGSGRGSGPRDQGGPAGSGGADRRNDPRDLARYLPLSNRPRVDETGVTNDWRAKLSELTGESVERRVRIGELGRALVAAYQAGTREIDPVTSGAVALARAAAAPLPIRAVIRDRTLRATDAGWEFGSGPELAGTARELVLFLYGLGPVPDAPRYEA